MHRNNFSSPACAQPGPPYLLPPARSLQPHTLRFESTPREWVGWQLSLARRPRYSGYSRPRSLHPQSPKTKSPSPAPGPCSSYRSPRHSPFADHRTPAPLPFAEGRTPPQSLLPALLPPVPFPPAPLPPAAHVLGPHHSPVKSAQSPAVAPPAS